MIANYTNYDQSLQIRLSEILLFSLQKVDRRNLETTYTQSTTEEAKTEQVSTEQVGHYKELAIGHYGTGYVIKYKYKLLGKIWR